MSKLVNISVDITKIPRDKLIPGKNGAQYASLDVWINEEPDQWGKDCSVNISQSKEEREQKARKVFCGNGKKLFGFGGTDKQPASRPTQGRNDDDDSIPPF